MLIIAAASVDGSLTIVRNAAIAAAGLGAAHLALALFAAGGLGMGDVRLAALSGSLLGAQGWGLVVLGAAFRGFGGSGGHGAVDGRPCSSGKRDTAWTVSGGRRSARRGHRWRRMRNPRRDRVRPRSLSRRIRRADTYEYDEIGNTRKRNLSGKPGDEYRWDAEGRVSEVLKAGVVVASFVHDASGNRLIRRDVTGKAVTLYLGGMELKLDTSTTDVKTQLEQVRSLGPGCHRPGAGVR